MVIIIQLPWYKEINLITTILTSTKNINPLGTFNEGHLGAIIWKKDKKNKGWMRRMNRKVLITVIIFTIIGTISCLLLGITFFGLEVFDIKSPFFQFVVFGLIGSISFILFKLKRYRDTLFILALLLLFEILWLGSKYPITHTLGYLSVVISTYIYTKYFFNKIQGVKYARPLILASLFAIFFVIVTFALNFIYQASQGNLFPFKNMPVGFLIGLGLGIGIELSEYLTSNRKELKNLK